MYLHGPIGADRELHGLRAIGRNEERLRKLELLDHHRVTDASWQTLTTHFDKRELLELLFVIGTYSCLAIVVAGAGLTPENPA